jgi:hypothetical protein
MVRPPRTKPCTFPSCDGRMILTGDIVLAHLGPALPLGPDGKQCVWRRWQCDADDSHVERAAADEL